MSGPVKVDKTLITVDDFRIANEHYAVICDKLNKGKYKSCKALCWKHSTMVGCNKKGAKCSKSHEKLIPAELANEFLTGQLVMVVFGGFANLPTTYAPEEVTATIQSLRTKIAASLPPAQKFGGPASVTNSNLKSPDVLPSVASLLLVRPTITIGSWDFSVDPIDVDGETIPVLSSRSRSCYFPGALTSQGLYFEGTEFNAGEHLSGEVMKCFMLAQGAAHKVSPSYLD